jgi:flagellar basal-body rod protein FlgB
MPLDINSVFDTHAKSLALGSQRIELLAANIANADTPNYLARDIDFKSAMAAEQSTQVSMANTRAGHIDPAQMGAGRATVLYRYPDQPAQDGNTVDAQKEKAAVTETALRYQTSLSLLNMRIRGLKLAITGGR